MQRVSPIVRRLRARLAAASGAIDLASIMVGVIVIGVISSIAIATVFAIIPWSQDKAAQESLHAVKDAQSVAFARYNSYFDGNGLVAKGLLPQKVAVSAEGAIDGGRGAAAFPHFFETRSPKSIPGITVNADGSCYVSAVLSPTGAVYYNTALNPTMIRVVPGVDPKPDTSSCAAFPDVADWPTLLAITSASVPAAAVGVSYLDQLTYQGSVAPTFTISSGALPRGLGMSSTGVIAGTPTGTGGPYTFTVTASSTQGSASTTFTMTVANPPTLPASITLSPGTTTVPYSATITATSGDTPTFALTAGALPPGLSLSSAGVVSGTPTAAGGYSFNVTATNSTGSASTSVTMNVALAFHVQSNPLAVGADANLYAIDTASKMYARGPNWDGQLGNGTASSTMFGGITYPFGQVVPASIQWAAVSAGFDDVAALGQSGHLYTFGVSNKGQGGTGSTATGWHAVTEITPTVVYQAVAAGYDHFLAIDSNGHLVGWGNIGAGSPTGAVLYSPTVIAAVQSQTFTAISAGNQTSAAIDTNGHLWTWGSNANGALGNGLTSGVTNTPTEILPSQTFTSVSASEGGSMLAIDTNGHLWGWGANGAYQLGLGTTANVLTPTEITPSATYTKVAGVGSSSPYSYSSYALDTNGNIWSMGSGSVLGLGGTVTTAKVPTKVTAPAGLSFTDLAANGTDVETTTSNGAHYSWGTSQWGQLDNSPGNTEYTPTLLTVP